MAQKQYRIAYKKYSIYQDKASAAKTMKVYKKYCVIADKWYKTYLQKKKDNL